MTRLSFMWTIAIFLTAFTVNGQTTDSIRTNILGKWTISKHTLPEKGKVVNKFKAAETKITYEFRADGTYTNTSIWLFQGKWDTVVTVGKWKISPDKKNILTYDSKFLPPHNKDGQEADHPQKIIKLTKMEFVTEESLYSETPGTSYYTKQK